MTPITPYDSTLSAHNAQNALNINNLHTQPEHAVSVDSNSNLQQVTEAPSIGSRLNDANRRRSVGTLRTNRSAHVYLDSSINIVEGQKLQKLLNRLKGNLEGKQNKCPKKTVTPQLEQSYNNNTHPGKNKILFNFFKDKILKLSFIKNLPQSCKDDLLSLSDENVPGFVRNKLAKFQKQQERIDLCLEVCQGDQMKLDKLLKVVDKVEAESEKSENLSRYCKTWLTRSGQKITHSKKIGSDNDFTRFLFLRGGEFLTEKDKTVVRCRCLSNMLALIFSLRFT